MRGEAEAAVRVVAAREVGQDGAALEDGEVGVVVVDNGGDAAVGVDVGELGLLLDVLAYIDGLGRILQPVSLLELLEQDADLEAFGGA